MVHEHVAIDGEPGFLKHPLTHENVKGLDAFMWRHVRYAGLEAVEMLNARVKGGGNRLEGRLLGSWPDRRRWLKLKLWYRLPARPVIRFFWMYIVKRGFLDGKQGRIYCQLLASHEVLINAKLLELELVTSEAPNPTDPGTARDPTVAVARDPNHPTPTQSYREELG